MATTTARAGLDAYRRSVRMTPAELVGELRGLLGAKLVAYLGSVKETRAVRQWADGERTPSADVVLRLRAAFRVAATLAETDSPSVVQAWFLGANPELGEVAPARLLREGDLDEAGPEVLAAARAFAATG